MKLPRLFHRHVLVTLDPTQLEKILSTLTDALTAAQQAVDASVATLATDVTNALAALATAQSGPDETAITNVTAALGATKTTLDGLSTQITTALAPTMPSPTS